MKVKVTKTIRISREYDDIKNIEDAKDRIDLELENDQFSALLACYFTSSRATVKRLD